MGEGGGWPLGLKVLAGVVKGIEDDRETYKAFRTIAAELHCLMPLVMMMMLLLILLNLFSNFDSPSSYVGDSMRPDLRM